MLNNSFGFGGTNASLMMKAVSTKAASSALAADLVVARCCRSAFWLLWWSPGPQAGPHTVIVEEGSSLARSPAARESRA